MAESGRVGEPQQLTHLAQLCRLRGQTRAEHVVVDDGTVQVTYAELAGRAAAVATRLHALGVGPGDRVVLQGRNRTAWVVAAFGVLTTGATLAPIGYGIGAREQERLLATLAPTVVIAEVVEAAGVPWLDFDDVMALTPADSARQLTARQPEVTARRASGQLSRPNRQVHAGLGTEEGLDPDTPALVLSSSGTTGAVKLVAMTHRQLLRLYADVTHTLGVVEDDRMLAVPPLSHSLAFNGILLVAMLAGAGVRLCPSYRREETPALIAEERLTVLSGPPTLYHDLERYAGPDALSGAARLAVVGGQTVLVDELLATGRRLGLREVVVGYGMTEACGTIALSRVGVDEPIGPQLALTVMPGIDVCVESPEAPVPTDVPGPILVRGYNVVQPAAGGRADGWFDTGDLGVLDADRRLLVVGRSTDRVIVSGFNVHPRDVERVLAAHPDVHQAVVIGVPDERSGERLVACVVPHGSAIDAEALRAYVREHLSAYQVPADVVPFAELPLTASGKIARSVLVDTVIERLG